MFLLRSVHRNLFSATEHLEVVEEYLAAEITQSCINGPFTSSPMGMHKLASLGYPQEALTEVEIDSGPSTPCRMCSINDGMPKDLYSLTYITVDTAINYILTLGPGTLLAKVDIKSAFRVLPLHPANCHPPGHALEQAALH